MDAMNDLELKDPNSVLSKAHKARDELNRLITPKFIEAQKLTETNTWNKYKNSFCLLKSLLESNAMYDGDGTFTISMKVDTILGFVFGAYDPSATSLTNLVYSMYKHPDQIKIVRKAIYQNI